MRGLIRYCFWGSLLAVMLTLAGCHSNSKDQVAVNSTPATAPKTPEKELIYGFQPDSFRVITGQVKRGQFLADILLPAGVPFAEIDRIAKATRDTFDVRKIRVGHSYTLLMPRDTSQNLGGQFIYQIDPVNYVVYHLDGMHTANLGAKPVRTITSKAMGTIDNSLYETLDDNHLNPALAMSMSEIFAWTIDFYHLQKGDHFRVVYQQQVVDEDTIGVGKIIAAQFFHDGEMYHAYYFDNGGAPDYFDEKGNSLRKAFLKSPLKFGHITSHYSLHRFHPIQHRWKAHLGTDYAAPTGTPIHATGSGTVIASTYTRFNGNYVKIKHNSTYTTQYLHMSRRAVKVGEHVTQNQVIGYVGMTGLATGPHVCYRFWKNGKQVDPLKEKFPPSTPVKDSLRAQFYQVRDSLQKELPGDAKPIADAGVQDNSTHAESLTE